MQTFAHFLLIGTINYVASEEVSGWPENPATAADEAATFLTGLIMDGAKLQP